MLNIILVFCFCAILGAVAHCIVGGGGNLVHLAFVGFCGYALSQTSRDLLGLGSIGIWSCLALDLVGTCIVILLLRNLKTWLIRRTQDGDSSDFEEVDNN